MLVTDRHIRAASVSPCRTDWMMGANGRYGDYLSVMAFG